MIDCVKCGAELAPGTPECPSCNVDPRTGRRVLQNPYREAAAPAQSAPQQQAPLQQPPVNQQAAAQAAPAALGEYGGLRRSKFFLLILASIIGGFTGFLLLCLMFGVGVFAGDVVAHVNNVESEQVALASVGAGILFWISIFILLLVFVGCLIFLGMKRCKNIGYTQLYVLTVFIPLYQYFALYQLFFLPEGYPNHKKLDTPAKLGIAWVVLGFLTTTAVFLLGGGAAGAAIYTFFFRGA